MTLFLMFFMLLVDHSIWIGTDNGGVYMLGSPGSLGDRHPSILFGKFGSIE